MDGSASTGSSLNAGRAREVLSIQKRANELKGPPDAALRKHRLTRAIELLLTHRHELVAALNEDFGSRSPDMSMLTDIAAAIAPLKHARANLDKWMKPRSRAVSPSALALLGARSEVRYQPKGVVGAMTPWNFPVQLSFDAIAGALAAGNRIMLKPSEFSPATSALMERLIDLYFDEDELAVVLGGADVGAIFASLPFDHLIFTGATSVGRHVMRAAADNLTPVTLELGGKSPVVIGRSADIAKSAARIMAGKAMNAGQVCLAPDYVLAPMERVGEFAAAAQAAGEKMFPTIRDNRDYTAIVNQRHYERVRGLVADARAKGAKIIEINPADEDFSQQEHRKIPMTLILDASADMAVMQEEIFGPVLPVLGYGALEETIAAINSRPRPLALYYFGDDSQESEALLSRTHSGGVSINDVIFHISQENLPFGGVGASGIGAHHGERGFREFSHEKAVFRQTPSELIAMFRPPYGEAFRKQVAARLKP